MIVDRVGFEGDTYVSQGGGLGIANPAEERFSPLAIIWELLTIMLTFHFKSWDQRDWIDMMRTSKSRGRVPSIFWKQKRESIDIVGCLIKPSIDRGVPSWVLGAELKQHS